MDPGHEGPGYDSALLRLLVGVDQLAGLEPGRTDDGLHVHALELIELVALDAVILHGNEARLGPLALLAELHIAHHGLEGGGAEVLGELLVIEAVGTLDGLLDELDVGITPGAEVVAERI